MTFRHLFHRSAPESGSVTVARTPPALRVQALSAATGQAVASIAGFERRAAARGMDVSLLWSAQGPDGALLSAALVVPAPGRTAAVLFSAGSSAEQCAVTGRVLDAAALDLAATQTLALLQCLPRPGEDSRTRALSAGGFHRLANLDYLERPNRRTPEQRPAPLPGGYALTPWHVQEADLLIELLQRTFEGTLDCPGLSSMRRGRDILDGHLHSGDGDTSLWRILRHEGTPVGAMLLSPSSATDSVDLIYLGLAPEARGRGLGAVMLAHGLAESAALEARTVQLAVDVSNTPAVQLYRRAGFVVRQQREAWVRPLSSGTSCPP